MQLSKFGYYSDFVVYPVVIITFAALGTLHMTRASVSEWLAAIAAGLLLWTLMEYTLHRNALHRWRYFSPMHALHHAAPLAFIGTPTWMSVSILVIAIFVPTWWGFGFNVADGLIVGVMVGYWWYGVVHHVIHHRPQRRPAGYFNNLRTWHMRHHYSPKGGNFGVTTSLWDHVFGTAIGVPGKATVS
jgi:sterol desaturase/sphingolipid hydroxylase (fatty acid hydroxylase superfamily)